MKAHPKLRWLSSGRVSRDGSPPIPGSKWIVVALVLFILINWISAGDLTTTTGKIYKDVTLLGTSGLGVKIKHSGGEESIPVEILPDCPAKTACLKIRDEKPKANDLQTLEGAIYKDVQILESSGKGVKISCSSGQEWIPYDSLKPGDAKDECDRKRRSEERTARLAIENADKSVVSVEWCRVVHSLIEDPKTGKRSPRFVYVFKLNNAGGKDWSGKVTMTVTDKTGAFAQSSTERLTVPANGTDKSAMGLFTGPRDAHGDAGIARWRIDLDSEKLATGDVPRDFTDDITR